MLAGAPADAVERLLDVAAAALSEAGEGFEVSACFGAVFIPSEASGNGSWRPCRHSSRSASWCGRHTKRQDGLGHIDGLAGREIPLAARIIAVCDAFEAMISVRPDSPPRTTAEALEELRRCAGTQFDTEIVGVFCKLLEAREIVAA